ncbi:MAG: efflux RND transporter periplasmic adaptor subunit, partial [Cyanobacteria bacterium J06633_8]
FAGIITRRFATEGDFVTPTTSASSSEGATSTSIAELSRGLEIEAKIPEANISKINSGQTIEIQTDTYSNETFKGRVTLIAPRAVKENNITSFRVKIALSSGRDKLKSGMNVKLNFITEPVKNALVIPLAAVVTQSNEQTGVYVADEQNEIRLQLIKISATSGNLVQVLSGLKKGDRVFISPPNNENIEGVDSVGF